MKPAIVAPIVLLTALLSVGQTVQTPAADAQTPGPDRLRWDWERREDLSWHASISRRKDLQPSERKRLIKIIADQIRPSDRGMSSEEQLAKIAAETRIKYMDLSGDGKPEVIAQAGGDTYCSPTGNCSFWIFRRRGTSYEVLLEGDAQTFTIQHTRTKGYLDIVLSRHNSAFDSEAREYKFDGNSYREGACFDVEWSVLGSDSEFHDLKEPRISLCGTSQ